MIDCLGWLATAVFTASYFCGSAAVLSLVQVAGAALWLLYGALIASAPVMAANAIVLTAAAWNASRTWRRG